jgi:hypothetical protein
LYIVIVYYKKLIILLKVPEVHTAATMKGCAVPWNPTDVLELYAEQCRHAKD